MPMSYNDPNERALVYYDLARSQRLSNNPWEAIKTLEKAMALNAKSYVLASIYDRMAYYFSELSKNNEAGIFFHLGRKYVRHPLDTVFPIYQENKREKVIRTVTDLSYHRPNRIIYARNSYKCGVFSYSLKIPTNNTAEFADADEYAVKISDNEKQLKNIRF
jgi:hypothetical protein